MYLELRDVHVRYGNIEALHGINIHVNKGEIVTILGANGAGKSTTLMSISGLVRLSSGSIMFKDTPLHETPGHKIVGLGISQSPEGRRIFGPLTVLENLHMGAFTLKDKKIIQNNLAWIFSLFPRLAERRRQLAGTLSGGEQQMLAIGRALMANPEVLLLDEPSLGLAPIMVKSIFSTIRFINKSGVTIVLVEQNARAALKLAGRGYVLEVGRVVMEKSAGELLNDPAVQNAYLGGVSD
ncbi:MAG: ABC transporter ATP-binding protein [Deltaproteobacteria bacterium]|jgi:branched-chain amino acid transport system ATP-binding protein|nr:ABC transporter ATP-binding protein [Deltaproteobacteria bacterium]